MGKPETEKKDGWVKYCGKEFFTPLVVLLLGALIMALFDRFYLYKYKEADIESLITYNSGPLVSKIVSPFDINYKNDKTPFCEFYVRNSGESGENHINIEIIFRKQQIVSDSVDYVPFALRRMSELITCDSASFYSKILSMPAHSSIKYIFLLDKFISDQTDVIYSVMSEKKNWSEKTDIKISSIKLNLLVSNLYAQEKAIIIKKEDLQKSGIYFGGYDPVMMANGIFILLQRKEHITKSDARDIIKNVEKYKEGVLFGNINILKYDELLLNTAIKRNLITLKQANEILVKAKDAGGVKIGDYNIIILQVEFLTKLLTNKKIQLVEGQNIIDLSAQP